MSVALKAHTDVRNAPNKIAAGERQMKTLVSIFLLLPALALAGSGFDGQWRTNVQSVRITGKPDVYLLAGGEYTWSSCDPPLKVKADGAEHKVDGHAYYDSAIVKVTGPNSDEIILKQGGREFAHLIESVSADGTKLNSRFTNHAGQQTVT